MNQTIERFGLEGVVVAETATSCIDGEAGTLVIAGRPVGALADAPDFEALCAALWQEGDSAAIQRRLGAARIDAFERLGRLGDALDGADGMVALRAALSHLDGDDPATIAGAAAVFAAAGWRRQAGRAPVAPDPRASHVADFLRAVTGTDAGDADTVTVTARVDTNRARALERYLVTVSDHGMNASTFAARVVTSTRSDAVSAVVAALGALRGPLHGGAPGPVLDMLDAVAAIGDPAAWVAAELAAGRRIMGMGHRVYRVRDPRAAVLERAAVELGSSRVELARQVEASAAEALAARHPGRSLRANVEFYTAVLLDAVGLDRRMFTPAFAVGRVAGWLAHIREQRAADRLIRPRARYVGPQPS